MSTSDPTNAQNISGYLGYVERVFNQGTLTETSGELQSYPISAFSGANGISVASTRVEVGGQPNWNFGLLDVATAANPTVGYQVTQNYLTAGQSINFPGQLLEFGSISGPAIDNILQQYGGSENTDAYPNTFQLGSLGMSLDQVYNFYQQYPYNATEWNNPSFWSSTPGGSQFLAFWQVVNTATMPASEATDEYNPLSSYPPSSFADFYQTLSQLQLANGAPAIAEQAETPSFVNQNLSTSTVLQTAFATYVQNYAQDIGGLLADAGTGITDTESPEAFATGWYEYLAQGYMPPSSVPSQIPITLSGTDPDGTTFSIPSGTTVATPQYSTGVSLLPNPPSISLSNFVNNFVQKMQDDFTNQLDTIQDWQGLTLPSGVTNETLFTNNFETFMNYLVQQGGSQSITSYDSFIQQWNSFVGPVALLNASGNTPNSESILTYEQIYNTFYPAGTPESSQFLTNLNSFVNSFLSQNNGTFNPSLMVDQWFSDMVNNVYGDNVQNTGVSLDAGNYSSTSVLNDLYLSLSSTIESLQSLTVAQANRLTFYTNYQQAYTSLMQKVPVVTQGDPTQYNVPNSSGGSTTDTSPPPAEPTGLNPVISNSPVDSTSTGDGQAREELNSLSAQYVDNLRSYRSEISDQGNAFQASVNQSDQSVNNDTTVATQILQTIAQIAKSLFNKQPNLSKKL